MHFYLHIKAAKYITTNWKRELTFPWRRIQSEKAREEQSTKRAFTAVQTTIGNHFFVLARLHLHSAKLEKKARNTKTTRFTLEKTTEPCLFRQVSCWEQLPPVGLWTTYFPSPSKMSTCWHLIKNTKENYEKCFMGA